MDVTGFIEDVTRNCDVVQERMPADILGRNAQAEYLKRHRLEGRTDRHSFKSRIPVVTYEDILPEILRIADGESSPILTADPITEFLTSSGTSGGEGKLIPNIKEDMERKRLIFSFSMAVINLHVPGVNKGKVLIFNFARAGRKTPGGLEVGSFLTKLYEGDRFRNRKFDPHNQFISPIESIMCLDTFQSTYTQMLVGLYERIGVVGVGTIFASGLLRVIRFLRLHYPELCQDIATGTLSPKITDPSVVQATTGIMRPDPILARTIECSKENWEGIIKRVWPNIKYLDTIVTGSMAQYIPTLDYYSGGLPKVSMACGSSEAFFGINLRPMAEPSEVSYTIMPNAAYFEFIPLGSLGEGSSNSTSLLDLAKVEVGKEYELVVTTYAGLYRYRVGDVILITGFHNAAPQFHFVRRENVLLSIDVEKTNEIDLKRAIDKASALLHNHHCTSILDYTAYADINTIPGHYVIYLEFMQQNGLTHQPSDDLLIKCCLEMEESLNSVYRGCRMFGLMGPLEIRIVEPGTFGDLMDYAILKGASTDQYKVPRCLKSLSMVKLLDSRVVSSHFSPPTPRWSPTAGGGCAVVGNK